jgi:hypothetical protein
MDAFAGFSALERRRIRRALGVRAKVTGYECFAMERRRAPAALRQPEPPRLQQREEENRRAWSALGEAERTSWRQRADAAHVSTVGEVAALATGRCASSPARRIGVARAPVPTAGTGAAERLNAESDTFEALCRSVSEDARAWKKRPTLFRWTHTERKLLEKLIELHGGDWKKVALGLPHRAHHANLPRRCRTQWLALVAANRRALSARALDATRGVWPAPYVGVAWDVYAARWFFFTTAKERARCRNLSAKRKQAGQDGAECRTRMRATAFAAAVAHDTAIVQSVAAPRAAEACALELNFSSAAATALGANVRFPHGPVGAAAAGTARSATLTAAPAADAARAPAIALKHATQAARVPMSGGRWAAVARARAAAAEGAAHAPLASPVPIPSHAPVHPPAPQPARSRRIDYYSADAEIAAAGELAMRCVPTLRDLEAQRAAHAAARDATRDAALQRARDRVSSFIYRYISRESCSQFDSLPLTYLTIPSERAPCARLRSSARAARTRACVCCGGGRRQLGGGGRDDDGVRLAASVRRAATAAIACHSLPRGTAERRGQRGRQARRCGRDAAALAAAQRPSSEHAAQ